jgi:ribosomal protein S18 acetylase RimI-like enzyme
LEFSVAIRPATGDDRGFVVAIASRLVDGFEAPPHRSKAELIEGDRRALAAWFDHPHAEEAMFIAEINGQPAGCAYLVMPVDYFTQRRHAHVSVLAVEKWAEGKGVGSALLDRSVAWAREHGSDRLTLSALVTNARARALYERKGFGGEYIRYVLPL